MSLTDIIDIALSDNYKTEYQPILYTKTQKIYAYEALARFYYLDRPLPPNEIFSLFHEQNELFFQLEKNVKKRQLNTPFKDHKVFVNLDPHVCTSEEQIAFWVNLFKENDKNVVEIIENHDDKHSHSIQELTQAFLDNNISFAYDDFGKDNSVFFKALFERSRFLKLDRFILKDMERENAYKFYVEGIIKFAHAKGKEVILEGVETKEEFALAKSLGVDFVQGFLFKPLFITH